MRFEILTIEDIKPIGEYKHIATIMWYPSRLAPWKKPMKKQAVSTGSGSTTRRWFYTDTFKQTAIDDSLDRFLKKRDYENQILNKLAT